MPYSDRKQSYFSKIESLLEDYNRIFIVHADNVGSRQMQQIRLTLRGKAVVLMGKNTMMKKAMNNMISRKPELSSIIHLVRGNVGFVFTNEDLSEIKDKILENKVPAPARPGTIAPVNVIVPAGPTGMDPGQTSFFQALNIATKIQKGQIEIISDVSLVQEGEKVGNSESVLLQKLNIKPFSYGLVILQVYDKGNVFSPIVLDLTDDDLQTKFLEGVSNIAAIGLQIGHPSLATLRHHFANAYKNILNATIACETFVFDKVRELKELLDNPEALAAANAAANASANSSAPTVTAAAPVVEEEEEEEELGGGLFGDDW